MEEINVKDFFNLIKKRSVLILLVSIIISLGVYLYSSYIKTPMYKTYTTLVLTKSQEASSETITQNDIVLNQKLVYTYSELIKSKRVLKQVKDNLNLKYKISKLSDMISVEAIENTEILKISVESENAKETSKIANEIAKVFSREVVNIYEINNVSIIDRAHVPTIVSNNTTIRDTALSFIVSIIITSGIIFILYYFDDTVKFSEKLEEEIKLPVIGTVLKESSDKKEKNSNIIKTELIVDKFPKSLVSEGIKSLRTNLSFSSIDSELKTILVTSSIPSEGKSFISANLAIAFAQTGKNVLLIDCDMRKGRQHKIFNISNEIGFSNLLIDDFENTYQSYIKQTGIKKLSVLPCGTIPPNPSELLNSSKNKKLIELLKENYDLIIFDGVPCNGLPDSIIMSTLVDKTIIVSADSITPKELLNNTKRSLENVNANIAGVILNKVNFTGDKYYGKYYSYYGSK